MVTLTTRTRREQGVTLVRCRLSNDGDEPRVALVESRLDGPTRVTEQYRDGEATLRVHVPAGGTVGAGFSTPTEPSGESPAALVGERAPVQEPEPAAVVAGLSDPRPPHEAVVGTAGETETSTGVRPDLDSVERRVERLEAVAAATTVPAAADALATAGGLDAVRELDKQVHRDRERLIALADRATRLAARAEAADPRLATLERLS